MAKQDKESRKVEKSRKKLDLKVKKRKLKEREDNDGDCSRNNKEDKVDKKKKKKERLMKVQSGTSDELGVGPKRKPKKLKYGKTVGSSDAKNSMGSEAQSRIEDSVGTHEIVETDNTSLDKSDKSGKSKKKHRISPKKAKTSVESKSEDVQSEEEVYHLSSGDGHCSKGMKKWLTEYHQSRPGLEILQQRIDDFITAHEERLELERKEREALAAEGGWTVVTRHKGKKRTTDSESGISVGSVAPAAVLDNMAKKKKKEVVLNFYNFQRREAQRNEVMLLQSKFEQDKKRIQQMRAARKFRPY